MTGACCTGVSSAAVGTASVSASTSVELGATVDGSGASATASVVVVVVVVVVGAVVVVVRTDDDVVVVGGVVVGLVVLLGADDGVGDGAVVLVGSAEPTEVVGEVVSTGVVVSDGDVVSPGLVVSDGGVVSDVVSDGGVVSDVVSDGGVTSTAGIGNVSDGSPGAGGGKVAAGSRVSTLTLS